MRSRQMIVLSFLLCGVVSTAEPTTAPDTIEARAQGCSTCHGDHGQGTEDLNFPRIAGKPAGYLLNQLQNFRDGQRSYPPMNYLLAYMHDDYLAELAAYFATQPAKQPPHQASKASADATTAAAGERLVTHGNAAQGIPACIVCHGSLLTGIQPGIPGLMGLNSRYIAAQLVSWRMGTRHAKQPDCMRVIASRLSETQVREVSAWVAAQSPADHAAAAVAGSWTTPIPCGSQP